MNTITVTENGKFDNIPDINTYMDNEVILVGAEEEVYILHRCDVEQGATWRITLHSNQCEYCGHADSTKAILTKKLLSI